MIILKARELVIEIVASSHAYDLHQRKDVYRRNGVQEYLAWITAEQRVCWWRLREGAYQEITADANGVMKSIVFRAYGSILKPFCVVTFTRFWRLCAKDSVAPSTARYCSSPRQVGITLLSKPRPTHKLGAYAMNSR